MSGPPSSEQDDARPPFMVELGLLPPYAEEDIEQAYLNRAKTAHPDHGGSDEQFLALQNAYELAKEYVKYRKNRRGWLAKQVDDYLVQQSAVEQLQALGVEFETEQIDWLRQSFGDFAELLSQIVTVRLINSPHGDQVIEQLVAAHRGLRRLKTIELRGSQLTDAAVLKLTVFRELERLDLGHTAVSSRIFPLVESLSSLVALEIDGTSVGWWTRMKIRSILKRRSSEKKSAHLHYLREEIEHG